MKLHIFGDADRERTEVFEAGLDELDIRYDDSSLASPARVTCRLKRDGNILRIDSEVCAQMVVSCARCLEPVRLDVRGSFALVVKRMPVGETLPPALDDGGDPDGDELVYVPFDTTFIDITDRVRDAIILAAPMKALCSDGCRGLCPSCGKNLNAGPCGCGGGGEDPRWNALNGLFGESERQPPQSPGGGLP